MAVNEHVFFKESVFRICRNLDISKSMQECLQYISKYIPIETMYLQVFEQELHSIRILAKATVDSAESLDLMVSLKKDIISKIETGNARVQTNRQLWIINNTNEEPISRAMVTALNEPVSCLLGMLLFVKNKPVGALICLSRSINKFNESHLELLSLLQKPFYIALANALSHREINKLKDLLIDDYKYLQDELSKTIGNEIIGASFGLKDVMNRVNQVANMDSPVLLLGETGTGKDVIANAIHTLSDRKDSPFICVNCGAIPDSLIDSELFGHEKGAFTGAVSEKRGRFERANKGTIFLDEIGELPLQAQVRLLRVIQNREIERIGGTKSISLDIRIIAATNRNLEQMVKDGLFREDLWYRINVFPISIPPLRQRKSDIPALVQYFKLKKAKQLKLKNIPELEPGSIDILIEYDWPGNIRELENVVERALILDNQRLNFSNLKKQESTKDNAVYSHETNNVLNLDDKIKHHILDVLKMTEGKIHGEKGAARILGINASTLRNRMDKLNINYKKR